MAPMAMVEHEELEWEMCLVWEKKGSFDHKQHILLKCIEKPFET